MHELPPFVKKCLEAVGLNSSRMQWKYHYFREGLAERKNPFGGRLHWITRQQKACSKCGTIVNPDERRCPECNARIPTRVGYIVRRSLGFMGVNASAGVTPVFLTIFGMFYLIVKYQEMTSGQSVGVDDSGHLWGELLVKWGALYEVLVREDGQWWRLYTMALLHGGIIHLLFNGYAIMQLGPLIEDEIGGTRTLVVITLTQLVAALASMLRPGLSFSVGASGFLFGLIGFGVGYFWKRRDGVSQVYFRICMQWGIYALLFGFLIPRVDNAAHIGGGVAGIALGLIFQRLPSMYHARAKTAWLIVGVACGLVWVICVGLMLMSQKDIAF